MKLLIHELGIAAKVKLVGAKTSIEVRDEMQNSDIFLLSSINEVLPTVLLEAQACELPIVATDVGSVRDMVANGIIVTPNNVEDLVNGVSLMLQNKGKWLQMGLDGRTYVAKKFDIQKITKKLIELYNS